MLEIDSEHYLSESNAILNYLAEGTEYLPKDRWGRANVLRWQFFEQYSHEPYIAVARFIAKYLGLPPERRAEFESKKESGNKSLSLMDSHLSRSEYLVDNALTIADISLYAYTHVAHEGGFELDAFRNIQSWITRIEDHPCHIPIG